MKRSMFCMLLGLSIAQADTILSQFPGFEVPCDGTQFGPPPFGCWPGEIRYLTDLGEVRTEMLKPTPDEPASWTPALVIAERPVVEIAAAPEPRYLGLIVAALILGAFWKWVVNPRRESER